MRYWMQNMLLIGTVGDGMGVGVGVGVGVARGGGSSCGNTRWARTTNALDSSRMTSRMSFLMRLAII